MKTTRRSMLTTTAFAVTVAAGLTGLSMSGQTKETPHDPACATATWPMIPDRCLSGADNHRTVRVIAPRTAAAAPETMAQRFALAFN